MTESSTGAEVQLASITFGHFLTNSPPGTERVIHALAVHTRGPGGALRPSRLSLPVLNLECPECGGPRRFRSTLDEGPSLSTKASKLFLTYRCSDCLRFNKTYAVELSLNQDGGRAGIGLKYGENPAFGPATSNQMNKLVGRDRDLFFKGRRCETQGLGVGAFAYYRRVVEQQKDRIFDKIIKVARSTGADEEMLDDLRRARAETQFTTAVAQIKHGLPASLFINGQNPLTLLHGALSAGLHDETDEVCLSLAQSVRVLLSDLAERLHAALSDDAELSTAVAVLTRYKSSRGNDSAAGAPLTASESKTAQAVAAEPEN